MTFLTNGITSSQKTFGIFSPTVLHLWWFQSNIILQKIAYKLLVMLFHYQILYIFFYQLVFYKLAQVLYFSF